MVPQSPRLTEYALDCGRNREIPGSQERDGLLPLNPFVPDRRDDLDGGGQHPEGDVEAHLVVAGTGGAMGHRASADPTGHLDQRQRLLRSLSRHAEGVDLAPQDVALDEKPDEPLIHLALRVHLVVRSGAHIHRLPADGRPFLSGGTAGVHIHGVHHPACFGQAGHAVGGVEPAGEGERQGTGRRMHIA